MNRMPPLVNLKAMCGARDGFALGCDGTNRDFNHLRPDE
jgi:hypothetical protein